MKRVLLSLLLIMTAFVLALGLSSCNAEKYNVKFLVDGELYATVQAVEDEPIKLPKSPEKDGFTFDGWYLDNGAWQNPFNESDACALSELCVYAKWLCAHTVTEWITDILPTCKDEGAQHKECSNCKQILETSKIEKLTSHTPAEAVVESFLDSSCTAQGSYSSVVYCSVCECMISNERIVIERKPHTEAADPEVAPTCTKAGLTPGKHCSVCNEILIAREAVPALGHTTREGEYKAPTCTVDGFTAGLICEVCNDVLEAKEKIPATGHSFNSIATPPTCTEKGYTTHTCHCGSVLVDSYVDALGHTALTVEATAPTCTEAGLTAGAHCSACSEILTPQATIPALGHDYSSELTSPTCTEGGFTTHTCHCGCVLVDSYVDALGHTALTVEAIAPTCTKAGFTMGRFCSACDTILIQQSVLPALGHTSVTDLAIAPTCTKAGLTVGAHCSVCNEILIAREAVPALGHTARDGEYKAPTCTVDGFTAGLICEVCNDVLEAKEKIPATGHSFNSIATPPTCTEKGYTTHTCHCGCVLVDSYVDALGHTALTVDAISPTCTEAGFTMGRYCSACDTILIQQTALPATGHTSVTDPAIAPTCTKAGLTPGAHCSVCSEILTPQTTISALGHDYSSALTSPTCTEGGFTTHTCHCGSVLVDSYVDALGHDYSSALTSPTCTEKGYTTHTCHCGSSYVDSYVDALGHTALTVDATAPTCTEAGLTLGRFCSVCNTVLIQQTALPVLGHTEVTDPATAPTCTKAGLTAGAHCSACSEILTPQATIPALGHDYSSALTSPTCTEKGYTTHTCHCGSSYVDSYVDALGHTALTVEATAPTCTEAGLTAGAHCSACSEILTPQAAIPALGHNYSSALTSPTCTEGGFTTHTCHCGSSYVDSYVDALGHTSVTDTATAPTCTKAGLTAGAHCSACSEILTPQATIPALGHDYSSALTSPTCTEGGFTTHTCHCGSSYVDSYVDALGHDYSSALTSPTCTKGGFTTHTCHCGSSYVDGYVDALGHTALTVDATAPTCTEAGLTLGRYCSVCNTVLIQQTALPATGHTAVTDPAIAPTCTEAGLTVGAHCSVCNETLAAQITVPASGHTYVNHAAKDADCESVGWQAYTTCSECDYTTYVEIPVLGHMVSYTSTKEETITNFIAENDSDYPFSISGNIITSTNRGSSANNTSATYTIIAKRALPLSLEYKTSCEKNYDFLSIKHNGTEKVRASGKAEVYTAITIDMAEGDTVTITYTKDESDGDGSDCVFVKLVTSPTEVRVTEQTTLAPATDELISSLLATSDSVACANCGKTLAENPHEESDT